MSEFIIYEPVFGISPATSVGGNCILHDFLDLFTAWCWVYQLSSSARRMSTLNRFN